MKLDFGRQITPAIEPTQGDYYETPASLACLYGVVTVTAGCNPDTLTKNSNFGSEAVAIVDAYDDPTALADLKAYAKQFGLPTPSSSKLQVVYANGSKPTFDDGWYAEEGIDTQMVYAMAPNAKIYLVEAASSNYPDLLVAEKMAAKLVAEAGGGEVSNSWGGDEFATETSSAYTSPFTGTSTVFLASTGDTITPEYPAALSTVVAVGGTTVRRNPRGGAAAGQSTWDQAGVGASLYVARPSYQADVESVVGTHRGMPDVALVANPNTGVWVYLGTDGGWFIYGGTSVAAPLMAGIINAAGHFASSTSTELKAIYANATSQKADFYDVTKGVCDYHFFYGALTGYDLCTGLGAPANRLGE